MAFSIFKTLCRREIPKHLLPTFSCSTDVIFLYFLFFILQIASDKTGAQLSNTRNDFYTSLHLGKRNDDRKDYLGAAFDDPAIWYYALEEDDPETAAVVKGKVPDPVGMFVLTFTARGTGIM